MNRLTRIVCVSAIILSCNLNAFAGGMFVIGVAPHTSARVIIDMYQPLRLYLEKALECQVDVVTAPDFNTFARRGLRQEFDLAITTGNQARFLQTDAGYRPLLTYRADFKSLAIVAAQGPIKKFSDLKGQKILGLSPTSLVTMWGQHWLNDNRIESLPIRYVSASDSVAQLVASGEAALGFMSLANFQKLPPELNARLRTFAISKAMVGRVYLLNSRHAAERGRIEAALWAFAATPEAKRYFEANKLEGFRKLKSRELVSMDRYAAEVRAEVKDFRQ